MRTSKFYENFEIYENFEMKSQISHKICPKFRVFKGLINAYEKLAKLFENRKRKIINNKKCYKRKNRNRERMKMDKCVIDVHKKEKKKQMSGKPG